MPFIPRLSDFDRDEPFLVIRASKVSASKLGGRATRLLDMVMDGGGDSVSILSSVSAVRFLFLEEMVPSVGGTKGERGGKGKREGEGKGEGYE